jgi:uncharacterized protein (DUF362 family)
MPTNSASPASPRTTLSRRTMLQCLGAGAVATAAMAQGLRAQGPAATPARCALARNGEPAALTRAAIEALGGMGRFVRAGQTVVIKPNIGWDRTPEQGADTHPEVVVTLIQLALAAGAKEVQVMDNTCNDARRCYVRSGIASAAEEAGAKVIHLRPGRGVETRIGGELIPTWPVFREILAADVLINAPVAKHHGLSRATLGMKNWFGAIDGRRNQLHQDVARANAELAAFFKPHLTVLDGTRVLLRNGPQGGNLEDVSHPRVVMAGTDPVAVEAFGGTLLGLAPEDLPQIALAEQKGLGSRVWQADDVPVVDLRS